MPIHGVGIQGHWSTRGLPYDDRDKALLDYAQLGLKVSISELDITVTGSSGGQLTPPPGAPSTNPATRPAVPRNSPGSGPMALAGAGRGGFGRANRGNYTVVQPAIPSIADSIRQSVPDLSESQQSQLASVSQELARNLTDWQNATRDALLVVQPQYTPGQLAYQHELSQYAAVQFRQNAMRDQLLNEAEISLVGILYPPQSEAWYRVRLRELLAARFGSLEMSGPQQAACDALIDDHARNMGAAKTVDALAASKATFWKDAIALLDDRQISILLAPPPDASAPRGTAPALLSADSLEMQARAYARLFSILEKHKGTIERVTFWGLNDRRSWRAGESPLLFDIHNQTKPAYRAVVNSHNSNAAP